MNAEIRLSPEVVEDIVPGSHSVSNDSGNRRPCNPPAEGQNHKGIQDYIEQISQNLTHHRLIGLALRPEDIRVAVGDQNERTAQGNDS